MVSSNLFLHLGKMALESLAGILFFPAWWYTLGFYNILKSTWNFLKTREKGLALFVWIKNIHKPMYAQTDWQGRLISLFMRIIQIIIRGAIMLIFVAAAAVGIILWLIFPIFVFYQIIYQL